MQVQWKSAVTAIGAALSTFIAASCGDASGALSVDRSALSRRAPADHGASGQPSTLQWNAEAITLASKYALNQTFAARAYMLVSVAESRALDALGTYGGTSDDLDRGMASRNGALGGAAVTVLTIVLAGATLVQIPIGWLADRMNRRRMLIGIPIVAILAVMIFPVAIGSAWLLWPTALIYGCTVGSLWAVSLILVGERYQGADIAAANMARGVLYGLGAFAGPLVTGFAFELWMPHGVLAVIATVALLFLPVAIFNERGPPPHQPQL